MKRNGNFKICNINPKILISHKDLEAIKHIVSIAPQEAQWFHRCERIIEGNTVYYRVYEMYIPQQYTSMATVESDPMMMYNFYKEIKQEHGEDKANEIMKNLTVWSHSHHTMGVTPSSQDEKQFKEQCKNAVESNIASPQLMLIFNKANTYYSKLWDPKFDLTFENIDMVYDIYDFSHITKQAKEKFLKPKKPAFSSKKTSYKTKKVSRDILNWRWDSDSYYNYTDSSSSDLSSYINSNELLMENSVLLKALTSYKPKSQNKNFFKKLKQGLSVVHLSALSEAICMDPEIIFEMGTSLDWLLNKDSFDEDFQDLIHEINSLKLTSEELKACIIFSDRIAQRMIDTTGKIDLDDILNEFAEAIQASTETTYEKIGW